MARSDFLTPKDKQLEYFSDFPINFDKSPLTNDLGRITNENAVKRSIRNLVLISNGEVPFDSTIGSQLKASLMEPFSPFTADDIKETIRSAIISHEKRVDLIEVAVIPKEDQNSYVVNILFFIINNPSPIQLDMVLKRVR